MATWFALVVRELYELVNIIRDWQLILPKFKEIIYYEVITKFGSTCLYNCYILKFMPLPNYGYAIIINPLNYAK